MVTWRRKNRTRTRTYSLNETSTFYTTLVQREFSLRLVLVLFCLVRRVTSVGTPKTTESDPRTLGPAGVDEKSKTVQITSAGAGPRPVSGSNVQLRVLEVHTIRHQNSFLFCLFPVCPSRSVVDSRGSHRLHTTTASGRTSDLLGVQRGRIVHSTDNDRL